MVDLEETKALAGRVETYLADPHAYFKAFSRTARRFQFTHPSPRWRVMTFVGKPEDFLRFRPLAVGIFRNVHPVRTWEEVLSVVVAEIVAARPERVRAWAAARLVPWMAPADPAADLVAQFNAGAVELCVNSLEDAFHCTQWCLLMSDVALNEAVVQVDPFTDAEWAVREADLQARRAARSAINPPDI